MVKPILISLNCLKISISLKTRADLVRIESLILLNHHPFSPWAVIVPAADKLGIAIPTSMLAADVLVNDIISAREL